MTTMTINNITHELKQKCIFCGMTHQEILAYPTNDCVQASGTHRFAD